MSMSPGGENAASITTVEDERVSLGQRRVNLVWEATQSLLAVIVIVSTLSASVWIVVVDPEGRTNAFHFMGTIAALVIGFYFGRTNHQRTGGVGGGVVGR